MRLGQSASASVPGPEELLSELESRLATLEQTTGEIGQLLDVIHRPTKALLVPIAQAGIALKQSIGQLRERLGAPPSPAPATMATATPAEAPPGRPMV